MKYLYKVEIEVDNEKVIREKKYALDSLYESLDDNFESRGISKIYDECIGNTRVYGTTNREHFGRMWAMIVAIDDSIIMDQLKRFIWYDYTDDTYEDIIEESKRCGEKPSGNSSDMQEHSDMKYLYKVEIEVDNEKVIREKKYMLSSVYECIDKAFERNDVPKIEEESIGNTLVYGTSDEDVFGKIWATIMAIDRSEVMLQLKRFIWYDYDEDTYEDIIEESKRCRAKQLRKLSTLI